jgi:RNA polymerase sigma factor (sigma-70 family)
VTLFIQDNEHFKHFAVVLEKRIKQYGNVKDWYEHQKKQVESLIMLEKRWRNVVIRDTRGLSTYRKFVKFISDEKRNILAARPYFRERQDVFAKRISKALKKGPEGARDLFKFAVNYQFILFAMKQKKWTQRVLKLAEEIRVLRQAIVEMNMPLAINRARVFYSRTPHSHLSYMDLIQIAAEGLMSGVDKYTPTKRGVVTKQFRSTAMGRMGGNFIEEYSETLVHFYPIDKRKLYRANKIIRFFAGIVDHDRLAELVNKLPKKKGKKKYGGTMVLVDMDDEADQDKQVDENHKTTAAEIADLMAAASTVSADSSLPTDPEAPEPITRFAAPESVRPDVQFEQTEVNDALARAYAKLTVWERKLLRLKGVRIGEGAAV